MVKGPVVFDLEDKDVSVPSVSDAPPVPEIGQDAGADGHAMQLAAKLAARKPSRLVRWFWALLVALMGAIVSVSAWDFVNGLIVRSPVIGYAFIALLTAFTLVLLVFAMRELAAFARLGRIDGLRHDVELARSAGDLEPARRASQAVVKLYARRADTQWGRARFEDLRGDQLDASGLLDLAEREILGPLDVAAGKEVQAAARQVATVTALVPLAFADVAAALSANMRMIRRIAEIYGGRPGVMSNWRLTRAVLGHLVATGAVAVGDDMLEPILGGGLLGKLSRRFGEGMVNGALTARVGVAAMEVCRPMPFSDPQRPKVRDLIRGALTGVFSK